MFLWKLFTSLECGSSFTCKLEGMFKDMELSHDIMGSYKQLCTSDVCREGQYVCMRACVCVRVRVYMYVRRYACVCA